jgi:ribosomal protein S18 acetylase RimI-like enzyme
LAAGLKFERNRRSVCRLGQIYPANMTDQLADIVWSALTTGHQHLALVSGGARKYSADVAPFAAFAEGLSAEEAATGLHALMQPGEMTHVIVNKHFITLPGLSSEGALPTVQMAWPEGLAIPEPETNARQMVPLTCDDAGEMVELIEIAFPGFFRERTCRMGPYSGIRENGKLIAMAGDRLVTDKLREVSGVCTHPGHTGKGLATQLILHKLREHRERGYGSFLHAAASNKRAIPIYERLGFVHTRQFLLQRVRRTT